MTGPFSKCYKTPAAALCIATLPPANAATLAPHFKARLGFPGLFSRPTGVFSNSVTRRLEHLPETSEAFALPGVLCCTQTVPFLAPAVYAIPEGIFEAVDENSGLGLRALFPTNCVI